MSASEFKLDFACAAQARLLQTLMNSESEEVSQAAGSARRDTVPGQLHPVSKIHHWEK